VISNGNSCCCNDTFTDVRFSSLVAKTFKNNTNYFYALRMSISSAILSEIFVQFVIFFKSYARKQ